MGKTKLVICDDSAMARRQLFTALPQEWEVDVSFASNGREALDLIRSGMGEVVFLDLTMPVMNGYEVLKQLRDESRQCSVFVVSADIQPQAVERVMNLGALDFFSKPIEKQRLRDKLGSLGLLRSNDPAGEVANV